MDEREAIDRLRGGDIGGLEQLVAIYQLRAVRTAYLITRERGLAEDVVQAAFLKAYERIGQFDTGRPFGPWFLRSVARDAIKAAERRDRDLSLDEPSHGGAGGPAQLPAQEPGPERRWEQMETAEEVWDALAQLTPKQRAAVILRYYRGFTEAEMAAALECSANTVKWRLHAARERLRLLLRPLVTD